MVLFDGRGGALKKTVSIKFVNFPVPGSLVKSFYQVVGDCDRLIDSFSIGVKRMVPEERRFVEELREGLYRSIFNRRDVRGQFLQNPVDEEVLARILYAAHHAPSVGFMQPWNFIVIRSKEIRGKVHKAFEKANDQAVNLFDGKRKDAYKKLKLEGILESPVNICVTCDRKRMGPVVLGRTANRMMDLFSTVCAVQNLWLAARGEGLGVGWVSIIHNRALKSILRLPAHVVPVAYLCVGYVSHFPGKPELESAGWLPRLPLEELVYQDEWKKPCREQWPSLYKSLIDFDPALYRDNEDEK